MGLASISLLFNLKKHVEVNQPITQRPKYRYASGVNWNVRASVRIQYPFLE